MPHVLSSNALYDITCGLDVVGYNSGHKPAGFVRLSSGFSFMERS